ncbi:hypothetical protein [Pedobacter sp.]|uniref:hypothetical protein n=1 Tax=Pedobacter sp. TaxID=1411316 RepID=UPI003D7FCA92
MKENHAISLSKMLVPFNDLKHSYHPADAGLHIERKNAYHNKVVLVGTSTTEVLAFLWHKLNKGSVTLIQGRRHRILLSAQNHAGVMHLDLQVKVERETNVFIVETLLTPQSGAQKTNQGNFEYAVLETLRSAELLSMRNLIENFNNSCQPCYMN